jgi:hypothetical protein
MRGRSALLLAVVTGALGAVTAPLWIAPVAGETADFGHLDPTYDPRDREASTPAVTVERFEGDVPVRSGRLADLRAAPRGPAPARLRIASIGLHARVIPVDLDGGTMEVPPDVSTVGWYRYGPTPGARGSAVVAAHVDSGTQGPGAFFHLRDLVRGDRVVVEMRDGSRRTFVVVARRSYLKAALPAAVFRRSGSPRLALVTCGGDFDPSVGRYTDNVVIYATPEASTP